MYKDSATDKCIFCPKSTYSNGTLPTCLSCSNDLSLITGLYYKIWNELPTYLTRNYISFEETPLRMFIHCSLARVRIALIFQWPNPSTIAVGWVRDLFVYGCAARRTDLDSKHQLHILPGSAGYSVSLELNHRPRFSSYRSDEDQPTVWNIELQVLSRMSIQLCPDSSLSGRPFSFGHPSVTCRGCSFRIPTMTISTNGMSFTNGVWIKHLLIEIKSNTRLWKISDDVCLSQLACLLAWLDIRSFIRIRSCSVGCSQQTVMYNEAMKFESTKFAWRTPSVVDRIDVFVV